MGLVDDSRPVAFFYCQRRGDRYSHHCEIFLLILNIWFTYDSHKELGNVPDKLFPFQVFLNLSIRLLYTSQLLHLDD